LVLTSGGYTSRGLGRDSGRDFVALGLLIGWHPRWVSLATALLLLSFAVAMLVALGPKAPLDYSVFTSACAAFLLFAIQATRKNT
jgi:hypothetical protein